MKLSEKILNCRKKAMLSQEALAERVGVSRQAISKWETGEASPEIGKLLSLAQVFGVTTDWLLSEDDPEPDAPRESPPPVRPSLAMPETMHTWVDDVPGMLGNLLRKYGWLFGVRLAVSGLLFLLFGGFVRLVSGQFFKGSMGMGDGFYIDPSMSYFMSEPYVGVDVMSTGSSMFNLFSGFIMLLGVGMIIAGIVLAVLLRKMDHSK